jgi:hypothetical protein
LAGGAEEDVVTAVSIDAAPVMPAGAAADYHALDPLRERDDSTWRSRRSDDAWRRLAVNVASTS